MLPIEGSEDSPSGDTSTVPVGAAPGAPRSCDSGDPLVGATAGLRGASTGDVAQKASAATATAIRRSNFINEPLATKRESLGSALSRPRDRIIRKRRNGHSM